MFRRFTPRLAAAIALLLAVPPASAWRSQLYPDNWTPDYVVSGMVLHDFSYAGYRHGEAPLPDSAALPVLDVAAGYGADSTGTADSTAAIQAAIDDAKTTGGAVVYFPPGLYKCDGRLVVTGDRTVLRGAGPAVSRLYFTECSAGIAYDGHIRFQGNVQWGTDIPLAADALNRSFSVTVNDASQLSPGDEIAVGWYITPEFIAQHGMTGFWVSFNGQWRPFFRRVVESIDTATTPATITLDVPLRYPAKTRDAASIRKVVKNASIHGYLVECGVEDLGFANAGDPACANSYNQIQGILFREAQDCWVRNVQSFVSPHPLANGYHLQSGGIDFENCNRITVADSRMELPQNIGSGGNGYLFQISRSSEAMFRDCVAVSGRHNFIQNWDFGTSGAVWLRCQSLAGAYKSEYHHSLAMACLVDSCTVTDGWQGGNRANDSSGAGHSVTQSVMWNLKGTGLAGSWNYGLGYVIGTEPGINIQTGLWAPPYGIGADPVDYVEGEDLGSTLEPSSLYEDQFFRRTHNAVRQWDWQIYE